MVCPSPCGGILLPRAQLPSQHIGALRNWGWEDVNQRLVGPKAPHQLSKKGSGGRTRNPVGVVAWVAELAQHTHARRELPVLAPGTVLGARPLCFCLVATRPLRGA